MIASQPLGGPVMAAEPPLGERAVNLTARDREIDEFLREFFAAAGQRVAVDPQVTGKVNGAFSGPAQTIWQRW